MSAEGGTKAIVAALAANLGIAATKLGAWALTMSSSMLAESIHSLADSGNQALLLVGGKRSKRGATAQHPFGYGRERYIYAFIVSIVLFSVGGLFALWEGQHKISDTLAGKPDTLLESQWWWVPIAVLVVAIGLETYSFYTAISESRKAKGKTSWVNFIRRAKAPELPVVLLEDAAALLGLILALFGVGLSLITGDGIWDGIFTLSIGLLLVIIAIILAIETKSLLLGESATDEHIAAIEKAILDGDDVDAIIHMKTLHLGPDELLVAAKFAVKHDETAAQVAREIDAVEARIRAAVPIARAIYLEPDLYRPAKAGGDS
ncbi:cation diffusion facilitator family transporter [Stackebrandtia nassauensis]|uniref:Cation diffusion facilitator family transporter n=1 Tax=Stackebrandtia nassauensis (strain DSM 44728 / CIP 108903 / NRRL B-16338 / NBRC 102104 / LLR-40K-21) TaxID=446470 RepID=D3Q0A4_STANL|nr:cation diffusion facilitator family transporter [Stackebrandtia nassauensis]ADD45633.1 cation diffusion facilitator family transporter [Stackebrandtia nassauensis DSM 44728]